MSRIENSTLDLSDANFNAPSTFESGQTFRWRRSIGDSQIWLGVVSGNAIKLSNKKATIIGALQKKASEREFISDYFSLSDDIDKIFTSFPQDRILSYSRKVFPGLRLLNQEPWECLISFICSINCNIPSIKHKIELLSRKFGKQIDCGTDWKPYSFPTPESLANATKRDLLGCSLGFRWRYVKFIAKSVASGKLDLDSLLTQDYASCLESLISSRSQKTLGVGPKVADCTLLYSLRKTEAFPIDIWILRCLQRYYKDELGEVSRKSIGHRSYFIVSNKMRKRFGKYAGYAQLYLYSMMRSPNHSM